MNGPGAPAHRVRGSRPPHGDPVVDRALSPLAAFDTRHRQLVHEPERTAVSPAELRRTLAEVRREGLATVRRHAPEPLVTVAAPIFAAGGRIAAALSVVVPEEHAEPRLLGPAVRTAARSITRGLGGS
ncbi:IclR family transcriptional regulator C-terminal domain-containing protein [Microbispora sp. NBRC 16548]|uniref:IclR family transcriptional regulator domain-containing protein n=1 Tax=Microbispora sp. NBRC 16548 TaxID=3030994 RepID=UPI0024A536F9|nr:IclR family transcriptional regulator C-terminal domain-containing protein [Microbispora sp. NBRC 16548]GLX09800.1 hypothetical protein Misp03_67260 [Microbispora sp. NBRC 16548]